LKTLGLILILFLLGCENKSPAEKSDIVTFEVEDLPMDFQIPSQIWAITEDVIEPAKPKPITYGPLSLKLSEKNKGILLESAAIFNLPSGGGEIDLSKVVTGQPGTFFLGFNVPVKDKLLNKKIYFISQSRQRKVDNEILGSGCNKLLDLSSSLGSLEFKDLITLNTTRDRHLSVLGGHFIFLLETETSWIVSQVTFYDSKRQDLFCSGFRKVEEKK